MAQLSTNTVTSPTNVGKYQGVSNPYAELPRQRTNWDKLLNWFGFRSGYDKAQEQYNMAGAEYNAQLEQLAAEDRYNSPAEQAMRERAAGLNPDLVGVSGEPGASFDNQQTPPDINAGDDDAWNVISGIGKGIIGALTGGISFLGDLASLKQIQIANDKNDLELGKGLISFLKDTEPFNYSAKDGTVLSINDKGFARRFFGSDRNVKRFARLRKEASDTLIGLTTEYDTFNDFADKQDKFARNVAQPYYGGFSRQGTFAMIDVLRPLQKAMFDEMQGQVKALISQHYKDYHKQSFEGDAYAKLNEPNSKVSSAAANMAGAIDSGNQAAMAENNARKEIAPIKIDKARIYKHMLDAVNKIPDKNIGTTVFKFLLTNQLFNDSGLGLGDIAGVATKLL